MPNKGLFVLLKQRQCTSAPAVVGDATKRDATSSTELTLKRLSTLTAASPLRFVA